MPEGDTIHRLARRMRPELVGRVVQVDIDYAPRGRGRVRRQQHGRGQRKQSLTQAQHDAQRDGEDRVKAAEDRGQDVRRAERDPRVQPDGQRDAFGVFLQLADAHAGGLVEPEPRGVKRTRVTPDFQFYF